MGRRCWEGRVYGISGVGVSPAALQTFSSGQGALTLLCCSYWKVFLADISHPFLNREQMTEKYMLTSGKSWSSPAEMFPPSPQNEFQWHFCQKEFLRPRVVSAVETRQEKQKFKPSQETKYAGGCCLGCWKSEVEISLLIHSRHFIPFQFHNCRISWLCTAANQSWTSKSWSPMWSSEWVC